MVILLKKTSRTQSDTNIELSLPRVLFLRKNKNFPKKFETILKKTYYLILTPPRGEFILKLPPSSKDIQALKDFLEPCNIYLRSKETDNQ